MPIVIGTLSVLLLGSCGSRPIHRPAVVVNSETDMSLGMRAYQDDNYTQARNYFARALAQYRSVDDRTGELDTLIDLADSALGQGEYAAARRYLSETNQITVSVYSVALKSHIALLSGYADMQAGDNRQAAARLEIILDDPVTPDDIRQAALFARTQTAFELKSADGPEWLARLSKALGNSADAITHARYQRLLAMELLTSGDTRQAVTLYANALDVYRRAYYRPGIAATLEEWAALSTQQKNWTLVRGQLQRALEVRLSMDDRTHSIRDLENLMRVDTALGDGAAAQQSSKLADYLKNGGNPSQTPLH